MICQKCKLREATGYMEQTVNGVKTRIYLCPQCFKQAQIEMFASMGATDLFGFPDRYGMEKCSFCGTTLSQIADTGEVGCPNCYEQFSDKLKPVIRNLQSSVAHVGAKPGESDVRLQDLQQRLKEAVKCENYEEAMVLSEKIKSLKGENK